MSENERTPLEEFIEIYSHIKDKFAELPAVLTKVSSFSEDIIKENAELKTRLKEIEAKFTQLKQQYETQDSKAENALKEAETYKNQLANVENQLSGLRKMYEEMAAERAEDLDVQELLEIYTILFEKVFAANPHTKILLLLRGVDKDEWTRDEIVKTTGFSPAAVIRALHELRNVEILETDDSATIAKLSKKQSL